MEVAGAYGVEVVLVVPVGWLADVGVGHEDA